MLDARHALGQLTADQAIEIAVERARRYGAGIVAVRHGFHFGTARRYAIQAADGRLHRHRHVQHAAVDAGAGRRRARGRQQSRSPSRCRPTGRSRSCSTWRPAKPPWARSAWPRRPGEPIPQTWAVKSDGSATTNPAEAIAGMLLPSGGPKGFGLAFLIDLMCGLLSGGASGGAVQPLYGDARASRTTARICSSPSTSRISAIRRRCERPRQPPPTASASGNARARRRRNCCARRAGMAPAARGAAGQVELGAGGRRDADAAGAGIAACRRRRWTPIRAIDGRTRTCPSVK